MVVPLHEEPAWSDCIQSATPWRPPYKRTLVIAPHPDDESLGCGGLINHLRSQGVDVQIVAVTDGENAYCDDIPLRAIRQDEQRNALKVLGVANENITRLHLPDSGLYKVEQELEQRIAPLIDGTTHVVAPWSHDFHPDHESCGRVARKLAVATGVSLTFYLFWTFHRGSPELLNAQDVAAFRLDDSQLKLKLDAIACHRSQLNHPSGDPILPDNLLWPARLPIEVLIPT